MKSCFAITLLFIWFGITLSQTNQINFQHLTSHDGLSQGHILCMMQDSEGYIWIGTYHGLNRYNGYDFDVFYAKDKTNKSLFIDAVFSLYEDRDGNIWCGTWGVDIFNKKTETFSHIHADAGENTISAGEISAMVQDANGNMWLATQGGGLNKYDIVTEKITWFKADENIKNTIKSNYINDILIDDNQKLWIATEDGGVSIMNLKDETIVTYFHDNYDPNTIPSNKISCLYKDKDGDIWMGDANGNISLYNSVKNNFNTFEVLPINPVLKKTRVMQISQDWKGGLLIAMNGTGLINYNYKNGKSAIYLHNSNDYKSISSNELYSLLVDRNNTVFIGSFGRGISKYSRFNLKFDVHSIPEDEKTGGDVNAFTDAVEDHSGHLIIGTYSGFLVYDKMTWTYKHYLPGKTYEENKILTVEIGPDSSIWFGTAKNLHRYDKSFNKTISYVFDENIKDHSIYAIEFDHYDNLWIGLFTKGLLKIEEKEWRKERKSELDYKLYLLDYNEPNSISGDQHWVIYNDEDSNLWIGGVGGLDRYNYKKGNFDRIFNPGTVKTIDIDSKGTLWLGTIGKGLFSYNPQNRESKRFTVKDGLCHNFIYGIVADKYGDIWINTENGLSRFNIATETFRNYDTRDGLPDNHFDDKSESKLADERIYMGTNKGFIIFNPENIKDDTSSSRIVLTTLNIDNRNIDYYETILKDTVIRSPIGQISIIELTPDKKDIILGFAALHYSAPHKIQYMYKLEGYDDEWINTGSDNRLAKYTNLDGGEYTFVVKATNSDGKWMEETLRIKLIIQPPFYKTIWFMLFFVIAIIIFLFLIFRWRINQVIRQKEILAKLVDKRTAEIKNKNDLLNKTADDLKKSNILLKERQQQIIEQNEEMATQRDTLELINATKDKFFSIIAHDLKNPFNSLMGFTELLKRNYDKYDKEKRLQLIGIVNTASRNIFNLLQNLLQWSRAQTGALQYTPQNINVIEIINENINLIKQNAKEKNIELVIECEKEDIEIFADINLINTVFRNLLSNAVKFTKNDGKINVKAKELNNMIQFEISDTGIGIEKIHLNKLFKIDEQHITEGTNKEKGTGLGLILCKEFIEKHEGKIWIESEPNKGTTFFFTIPCAGKL